MSETITTGVPDATGRCFELSPIQMKGKKVQEKGIFQWKIPPRPHIKSCG